MSDYKPEKGHKVRVVIEGEVKATGRHWFALEDRCFAVELPLRGIVSIERLPHSEPEWQPEDVVLDARGTVFSWTASGQWLGLSGRFWPSTEPLRPLTLIARDGKPVQS